MKYCNIFFKNDPIPDGAITVSKTFRARIASQDTAEIIVYEYDFMDKYFDVDPYYEIGTAILELPSNLPAD